MSEPVAFISHFRVKEGGLAALKQLNRDVAQRLQTEKPRTLVFLAFMDQDRTRVTFLHVFADQESMDLHFEGSADRGRAALELVIPEGWDVYGQPSDDALETLRQAAAAAGVLQSSSEWTITEFEPPSRLVHEGREPTMESRFTWTLEQLTPSSTRLSQVGDFVMIPRLRPLGWLIETIVAKRMLSRETGRMLRDIKRIAEAEAGTAFQ